MLTFTPPPSPTRRAYAAKIGDVIYAGTAVPARVRRTLVEVDPAVRSREPRGALAQEPVDPVDTLPPVVARLRDAVVHVLLAVVPLETLPTYALVVVTGVDASPAVLARVRPAGHLPGDVARGALPLRRTPADEHGAQVLAGAAVLARRLVAVAVLQRARLALPTVATLALEVGDLVRAAAVVVARVRVALICV